MCPKSSVTQNEINFNIKTLLSLDIHLRSLLIAFVKGVDCFIKELCTYVHVATLSFLGRVSLVAYFLFYIKVFLYTYTRRPIDF